MNPSPVTMDTHRIGFREVGLLLIAGGFASLMIDLGKLAIVTGWLVVAIWALAMVRGPRPTPLLTFVYGAGLFVTTFWWPEVGWWPSAIALMWVGLGLIGLSLLWALFERIRPS